MVLHMVGVQPFFVPPFVVCMSSHAVCYLRVSCECPRDVVREAPDVDESPLETTAVTLAMCEPLPPKLPVHALW